MRILHLLPYLTGGGAERQLLYLSREQRKSGHEVHIAYMNSGPGAAMKDWGHAKLHVVREGPTANPVLWREVIQLVRRTRPHIIHTWIHQMDIVGGAAATLLGVPWLMREASAAECYPPSWRVRLRSGAARFARMIVSNSPGGDRYWRSVHPRKMRRVIPNGLPIAAIDGVPDDEPLPFMPDGSSPLAVFTGRLGPEKNLDNLIEAFVKVMGSRPLTAILCGEGELRGGLEDQVRRHGLENRILLPGHLPGRQVWGLMKRADVFTLVSHFEGLPNVVMEAMACGAPLVVSDISAHRDFLNEGLARFAPPDAPDAIAEAIEEVLDQPEAARERANEARAAAMKWSIPEMARRYEDAYEQVILASQRR